jgi:hypothetical protein
MDKKKYKTPATGMNSFNFKSEVGIIPFAAVGAAIATVASVAASAAAAGAAVGAGLAASRAVFGSDNLSFSRASLIPVLTNK